MQGDKIKALIGKYINQLCKDKLVEEALQELDQLLKCCEEVNYVR